MSSSKRSPSRRKKSQTRGLGVRAVEEAVVVFIKKRSGTQVGPNVRFIDDGILDSFELVELLAFLENRFSVRFRARDTGGSKLATPRRIAQWVAADVKKRGLASLKSGVSRRVPRRREGAA